MGHDFIRQTFMLWTMPLNELAPRCHLVCEEAAEEGHWLEDPRVGKGSINWFQGKINNGTPFFPD